MMCWIGLHFAVPQNFIFHHKHSLFHIEGNTRVVTEDAVASASGDIPACELYCTVSCYILFSFYLNFDLPNQLTSL